MNKNDEQQFLPAAVQQADTDSVVGLHPQIIIIVHIDEDSSLNAPAGTVQTIVCFTEADKKRFEITLLADDIADGGVQRKLKFLRRLIENLCGGGWRVRFFKSFGSASMMLDRAGRILLINTDAVLRMPYRSMVNLLSRLPEMIANVYKGVKSTVKGGGGPNGINSLSASENACISLIVSEKGLLFPHGFVLSAEEQMMRIAITDTELIVSAGRRRWIHRSAVAMPFHAYKTPVTVENDAYLVAVPPDVLQTLGGLEAELWFEMLAD
jgi:hypothetical protein